MKMLGMSQSDLEMKAFGRAGNTFIQNLRKGASPAFDRVEAAAAAVGLETYLGSPRRGFAEEGVSFQSPIDSAKAPTHLTVPWRWPVPGRSRVPVSLGLEWLNDRGLVVDRLAASEAVLAALDEGDPKPGILIIDSGAARRGSGLWCYRERGKECAAQLAFLPESAIAVLPRDRFAAPRIINDLSSAGIDLGGRVVAVFQTMP